jgi:hypothetical protein
MKNNMHKLIILKKVFLNRFNVNQIKEEEVRGTKIEYTLFGFRVRKLIKENIWLAAIKLTLLKPSKNEKFLIKIMITKMMNLICLKGQHNNSNHRLKEIQNSKTFVNKD